MFFEKSSYKNVVALLMVESHELWTLKPKLWLSQILDFDPFDKQLCYWTCLRKLP